MEFSLEDNRAGAGSSVLLSPEIVAIRTKLVEACDGKTFADTIEFLKQLLDKEEDEQKRLGILAARVLVLRQRVSNIQEKEDAYDMSQFVALTQSVVADDDEKDTEDESDASDDESWVRVRITENSIVKGVRFPKGVIVDVHNEEADALVGSGKAEVIEINEENGDTLWQDSIKLEMKNNRADFQTHDGDTKDLVGYEEISGHIIFDIKLSENFRRKACFVADGHLVEHHHQYHIAQ